MRDMAEFVANLVVQLRFERLTDALVQKLSTFNQQRVVRNLLSQRVLEYVIVLDQSPLPDR